MFISLSFKNMANMAIFCELDVTVEVRAKLSLSYKVPTHLRSPIIDGLWSRKAHCRLTSELLTKSLNHSEISSWKRSGKVSSYKISAFENRAGFQTF